MLDGIDAKRGEDGIFGGSLKKDHIPAGQAALREVMDDAYGQFCLLPLPVRLPISCRGLCAMPKNGHELPWPRSIFFWALGE